MKASQVQKEKKSLPEICNILFSIAWQFIVWNIFINLYKTEEITELLFR